MGDERAVSPLAFTSALASAANGVSIVTAADGERTAGLTVSSLCSVCAEPPMMLACVNADNAFCSIADDSGHFVINVLAHGQQALSNQFAGLVDPSPDNRFSAGDWDMFGRSAPVLNDALVALVCVVDSSVLHGSHRVYFGRVIEVLTGDGEPLVYTDRGYARVVNDPPES